MTSCTVLSVGAAGKFAGLVVPELARRGVQVRGLVTKAEEIDVAKRNGAVEAVVGDLRDPASLNNALRGIERVFYIAPVFAPEEVQMGVNMVAAAQRAGVRRIVFSSVIHPILSALGNHAAKAPVEEALLASNLEYAILHPALLFQNYAAAWPAVERTGVFAEPYSADVPVSRVDYRDVAEVAAIAMTEDRLLYGTFELASQGNLDRHGVAALMGGVLGRKVEAATTPFGEWADKAGIPEDDTVRPGLEAMYAWYDEHGFTANPLTLEAILGRPARTLRAYLEEIASASKP